MPTPPPIRRFASSPAISPTYCAGGAFTLIELLIVVAVIGLLVSILLPTLGLARNTAQTVREMSAARQLSIAHRLYTSGNNGLVLPGYASGAMVSRREIEAIDNKGRRLGGPAAQRYPWRLLPFVDYELGSIYRDRERIGQFIDSGEYAYLVSLTPGLGLNQTFVGGSADSDGGGYAFAGARTRDRLRRVWGARWYVKRASDVRDGTKLLVFATSDGGSFGGITFDGFYRLTPPALTQRLWAQPADTPPSTSEPASSTGNVSFRWRGKSVAAMFDGHAESLTYVQAQDMRRWCNIATDAEYVLPSVE